MPLKYTFKKPIGRRVGDHVEYEATPLQPLLDCARTIGQSSASDQSDREHIGYATDVQDKLAIVSVFRGINPRPFALVMQRFA